MSIINKMHKGLQANNEESPILSSLPAQKQKKRVLLFILISLLLASSIGLSFLIYDKENVANKADQKNQMALVETPKVAPTPASTSVPTTIPSKAPVKVPTAVQQEVDSALPPTPVNQNTVAERPQDKAKTVVPPQPQSPMPAKKVIEPAKPVIAKTKTQDEPKKTAHLVIKKSILTASELADIHLKSAEKALANGDTKLASEEKIKALNVKPDLHHVRESLALYYYGIGEQEQAKSLLQQGAIQYPEHSDFNLMLSRIALKNGEQKKAYLYLQQSPPEVKGHLDYHVSYAILAQKFKDYSRSEPLFEGLLAERPNNGRWRMSLAIAQDKLGKEALAVENYRKALLQVDLSSNAKKYINQRLTYLANQ